MEGRPQLDVCDRVISEQLREVLVHSSYSAGGDVINDGLPKPHNLQAGSLLKIAET